MSENVEVCRVCVATEVPMTLIVGTPLQIVYDRLTNSLPQSDNLPLSACYMCYARLRKSHELMETAARAALVLTDLLKTNKMTKATISQIKGQTSNLSGTLAISPTRYVDIDIDASVHSTNVMATVPAPKDTVPPMGTIVDMNASVHGDVKPVPVDVQAAVQVEVEIRPVWEHTVKLEIKEEPLDFDETILCPDVIIKNDDEGSDTQDDDDDIPLKTLSEQQRSDVKEVKGGPAQSSPVNQKVPTASKQVPTKSRTLTGDDLVCKYCQRLFKFASDLKRHLRVHTNERPHQCNICKSSFKLLATLKKHFVIHTGETHTCDVCNRRFRHLCSLQRHKRIHTGEKPYVCNVCQKSFTENSVLKKHILVHTGERPHECHVCARRFRTSTDLKKHVLVTHTKRFECDKCQRNFVTKCRLEIHLRKHVKNSYSCNVCNRSFKKKSSLNRHSMSHTGERPYSCDICDYRCSQNSYLKIHLRTHTGEKPFECDVCHSRFGSRDTLRTHLRIHTGESPYQCTVCNRSFKQHSTLTKHSKTHL